LRRPHHLPLGNFIDRVDVVLALHSFQVALMNRVDSQISRASLQRWPTALSNRYLSGPGLLEIHPAPTVLAPLSKVINVRDGDLRERLEFRFGELVKLAVEDLLRRRTAERVVRFIHHRHCFDTA